MTDLIPVLDYGDLFGHWIFRALRDGPAPRYVEDGWRVRYATGAHYNVFPDKDVATAIAAGIGGTAHAIYRRVEGDK